MGVRVVTDSACDLPQDLVDELGIEIVPLTIRFGSEELVDRKELGTGEFWRRLATSPVLPETSAPSAGAFTEAFRRLIADGADGIVCINLSSKLSATMQAAQVAARAVADECRVEIVDSLAVSMGLGSLCLTAARRADDGASIDEILADVIDRRDRTKLFGTLDTLEYLRKGGRIGAAQHLLGSVLAIKPVVEVRDGVVAEAGKVRTRSKALKHVADKLESGRFENVCVLHGDAPDLDEFLDLLAPVVKRDDIVVGQIGPVIGTHAGPRVIGVTYQVPR
ncbi:MAG TPA: DegV family protein [Acidimicrobiia bacterium]|nr:DegV family protein [Acidimicrobiia bacterium]